jgi:hypothetical protein
MTSKPSWQSTIIALAFIALVGGIFIAVYERDGTDAALKVWGALGTLVGVVVGAVPTYFFGQTAVAAHAQDARTAKESLADATTARDAAERQAKALLAVADPQVVANARQLAPDMF